MKASTSIAKSKTAGRRVTRACEREGLSLDFRSFKLRGLMSEQSIANDGVWMTYYEGAQSEFVAAGIPVEMFPGGNKTTRRFNINGQPATLTRKPGTFELALSWPNGTPWYHSASHPATAEIERMIRRRIHYFVGLGEDDEIPVQRLIECEDAVDYRLPPSKRFKFARGQSMKIHDAAEQLFRAIRNSEVMPIKAATSTTKPARRGNVVDIGDARKLKRG